VVLVGLKSDLDDQLASFSALTLLVGSEASKNVSEIACNVLSGLQIFRWRLLLDAVKGMLPV